MEQLLETLLIIRITEVVMANINWALTMNQKQC